MPKFNVEEFFDSLGDLNTPAEVDQAFAEKVFALPEAERKAAAAALDKEVNSIFEEELLNGIREIGIKAIRQRLKEDFMNHVDEVGTDKEVQITARITFNIRELRGEDASPLVKAFTAAAEKPTDRNSVEEQVLRPLNAVIDALAEREGITVQKPATRGAKNAKI